MIYSHESNVAIEDVITTRLIDETFAADSRILKVAKIAGSTTSRLRLSLLGWLTCQCSMARWKGKGGTYRYSQRRSNMNHPTGAVEDSVKRTLSKQVRNNNSL
jgi:hypothetical protein